MVVNCKQCTYHAYWLSSMASRQERQIVLKFRRMRGLQLASRAVMNVVMYLPVSILPEETTFDSLDCLGNSQMTSQRVIMHSLVNAQCLQKLAWRPSFHYSPSMRRVPAVLLSSAKMGFDCLNDVINMQSIVHIISQNPCRLHCLLKVHCQLQAQHQKKKWRVQCQQQTAAHQNC